MVEAGLPKVVAQRSLQSWGDEDVPPVLDALADALKRGAAEMSGFDRYKKEVMSGALDWTPMHTSDLFWRQNAARFEERDFQVLRVLLKLLEASREVRVGSARAVLLLFCCFGRCFWRAMLHCSFICLCFATPSNPLCQQD
jgi:hypothetical protein